MADPARLQVQKALTAALREITPGNGYAHDLSDAVFRGRRLYASSDPLPMVSILEVPLPPDQRDAPLGAGARSGRWELVVQGFVKDDPLNPTDPAHYLMHDVKKRLADEMDAGRSYDDVRGFLGLPSVITDMQIGTGVVRPPDEVSAKAYFWLVLEFQVVEKFV